MNRLRRIIRSMTHRSDQAVTLDRQVIVDGRYEPQEPVSETPEQRRARILDEILNEPWREENGRDW